MISKTCCLRAACVCVLCECPPNSPVSNGCRLSANNNVVKRSKHHKVSLCGCVVRRCACIVCVCWGLTSSCFGGNTPAEFPLLWLNLHYLLFIMKWYNKPYFSPSNYDVY